MSNVQSVTQETFQSEVLQSDLPVLVDFFASWCPPCRMLSPIFDRLADEFAGQIKFVKIDSDEEPQLSESYNVTGLPTLVFIDRGNHAGQFSGLPSEAMLRDELQRWLKERSVA